MIICTKLSKNFKSYKKAPGIKGTLKAIFYRDYQIKNAVLDFNLNVKKGEIIGLLGPNGAGKTTLMKMFTGIIVPSQGTLKVLGHTPSDREKDFRKRIALVMGQKSQLWWDIPALDSFLLLQKYYEISNKQFKEKIQYMSKILNVEKLLEIHVRKLSLGERMKMELMASLLHNPDLIFLDEPTIGLDLIAQENVRRFIKDYHKEHKTTIVITSHYMADVSELCHRLVLIFSGQKNFDGPIANFSNVLGKEKILELNFSSTQNPNDPIWSSHDANWDHDFLHVELRIPDEGLRDYCIKILNEKPVTDIKTSKMPIEKVMKELIKNPKLFNPKETLSSLK